MLYGLSMRSFSYVFFDCKNALIAKSTQELVDPKSGKHH